jgi:transposase-like protein
MLAVVGTSLSVHEGYVDTSEQMTVAAASQVKKRQKRSVEEKRRIVEETLAAGASVACVAGRHDVNANQVFTGAKSIAKDGNRPTEMVIFAQASMS